MLDHKTLSALRKEYTHDYLDELHTHENAMEQFHLWFQQALTMELPEPNAMSLGTSNNGQPSVRIVLMKSFDQEGFVFFTNYESRKGQDLAANPKAALTFFWHGLERQVRIEGLIEKVSEAESDEYYHSRDRGSRIGAWASPQSQPIPHREALEARLHEVQQRYDGQDDFPRPPHWGGYRLRPENIEFWQGRPSRLHDRLIYHRQADGSWRRERLAP